VLLVVLWAVDLFFLIRQLIHLMFFKTVSLSFLAFCIPGLCASLYWSTRHYSIRLLLPIVCMGLFIIHPVGAQAFAYSLLLVDSSRSIFLFHKDFSFYKPLAVFIAHAVGSVIWLYTVPMTAAMWMDLCAIVLFERIAFALGMVVTYHVISFIFGLIDMILLLTKKLYRSTLIKLKI